MENDDGSRNDVALEISPAPDAWRKRPPGSHRFSPKCPDRRPRRSAGRGTHRPALGGFVHSHRFRPARMGGAGAAPAPGAARASAAPAICNGFSRRAPVLGIVAAMDAARTPGYVCRLVGAGVVSGALLSALRGAGPRRRLA